MIKAAELGSGLPLRVHETAQDASLGVTAKAFVVPAAAAMRAVAVEGDADTKLQSFCTFKFQEQTAESRPSEIVAATVFVPTIEALGEKVAILCAPLPATLKLPGELKPLSVQANVIASELASDALAVKFTEPLAPTTVPEAAGDCELQVGGVFLRTVQV